jgi:hypothetical protein
MPTGPAPHVALAMEGLRHRALFIGGNTRGGKRRQCGFVPVFLSDIPQLFTSSQLPLVECQSTGADHGFGAR